MVDTTLQDANTRRDEASMIEFEVEAFLLMMKNKATRGIEILSTVLFFITCLRRRVSFSLLPK